MKKIISKEFFEGFTMAQMLEWLAEYSSWSQCTSAMHEQVEYGSMVIDTHHHVEKFFAEKIGLFICGEDSTDLPGDIQWFSKNAPHWILCIFKDDIEQQKKEILAGALCCSCAGSGQGSHESETCWLCNGSGHPKWEYLVE